MQSFICLFDSVKFLIAIFTLKAQLALEDTHTNKKPLG